MFVKEMALVIATGTLMLREIKNKHYHYFLDNQNHFQGNYISWHMNGTLFEKAFYIDDRLHDEYYRYGDNSQLDVHCFYNHGRLHGEYKWCRVSGILGEHCFYKDGKNHGEYKAWDSMGELTIHCFYVNGKEVSFDEIPYPETDEDRLYFTLKYNLPLLPVEILC